MNSTIESHAAMACPVCRTPLPAGAPHGLCPACLLEGASATTEAGTSASTRRPETPDLARVAAAFPQLEILGLVGAGGMGAVFQARQPHLDRYVALKVLPEALGANPAFAERFNREARVLARLNHPHIVTVHEFGKAGGFFYLLMEYVDGVNLRQAMRAGRFSPAQALALVPRICEALQFAHEEGILHRDIKPENILLDARGRVKIADFGIAKLVGDGRADVTLTVSGAALGTPAYMAPEQIEHPSEVDHRADIYSLGVVLYELLTGELPLGRFAPPSQKTPLDERVDQIVLRALAKERELRQQSAGQMKTEVEALPTGVAPGPAGVVPPARGPAVAAPDFLLCHPRLPRMAQAITVYALIAAPVLWLLGLTMIETEKDPSPYAQFVGSTLNLLTGAGDLLATVLLVAGGLGLRALRVSGPRWIRAGIWCHLGLGVMAVLGEVWLGQLRRGPEAEVAAPGLGEVLLVAVMVGVLIFEITALVWLHRHAHRLARIFAEAAPDSADAAAEVELTSATTGTAPYATLAASLTGTSLALGLAALGGLGMLWMSWRQDGSVRGALGPVEVSMFLAGWAVIGGLGAVGLALGGRGMRTIRRAGGRVGGRARCLFAALGWPLVVGQMAVVLGVGAVALRMDDARWAAWLAMLGMSFGAGELLVRWGWRWMRNAPPGRRSGRLPGWARGLVLGTFLAGLVTVYPAYSIWFRNHLVSQIAPMAVTLRPDPAVDAGGHGIPSALQLGLEYPPRSIVWLRMSLWRAGRLQTSPLYTAHVVNGGFRSEPHPLLFRAVSARDGDPSWNLVVSGDGHSVSYSADPRVAPGVAWEPVMLPGETTVSRDVPQAFDVLRGRGLDGTEWTVKLELTIDPLPPSYLFEGAVAGRDQDWSGTASRAAAAQEREGNR